MCMPTHVKPTLITKALYVLLMHNYFKHVQLLKEIHGSHRISLLLLGRFLQHVSILRPHLLMIKYSCHEKEELVLLSYGIHITPHHATSY